MLVFLCFGKISWAVDVDDDAVTRCLEPVYDAWMGAFKAVLTHDTESNLGLKMQIFKILSVLFRDIKSYGSRSVQDFVFSMFKCLKSYQEYYTW